MLSSIQMKEEQEVGRLGVGSRRILGRLMYLRWRLSNYDHVGELITLMGFDWEKMRILDVGSGPGRIISDRRFSGLDLTCLDIDKTSVEKCKEYGFEACVMDMREIPKKFFVNNFDIVWCLDILEHIKKPEAIKLLKFLERMVTRRVIVFIPLGNFPQDKNPTSGVKDNYLIHRSYWEKSDFLKRGYKCKVLKGFHWDIRMYCSSLEDKPYPVVRDAMWAVWER